MHEQVAINSLEFALTAQSLQGEIPLDQLSRLHDVLMSREGSIRYHLRGGKSTLGKPMLSCAIEGDLALCCQRCLSRMDYHIDTQSALEIVTSESELAAGADDDVWSDKILASEQFDVVAVIEDELLLSLPIAPMHDTHDCHAPNEKSGLGRDSSPFAALAAIKSGTKPNIT